MITTARKTKHSRFLHSEKALGVPVTYLILFVSTMLLISVTYVFAVQQVNNQAQSFQMLTAEQDMTSLDNGILSVVSQPGAATTLDFRDSGGQLNVVPSGNNLSLSITDGIGINATVFNGTTGQIVYDLPSSSEPADIGFYMEGDSNTITNQSGASLSQLYIAGSLEGAQIRLNYRPQVTYAPEGTENDQAVTNVRIYIVNLNSSAPFALGGELPLKISCLSTALTSQTYQVSYPIENLAITSQLNGALGSVTIPISSTAEGAIINLQIVTSNISIVEGLT